MMRVRTVWVQAEKRQSLLEPDFFDEGPQRFQQSCRIVALNRVTGVGDFNPASVRECGGQF